MHAFIIAVALSASFLADSDPAGAHALFSAHDLLDQCTASLDRLDSCALKYESEQRSVESLEEDIVYTRNSDCDIRFDKERIAWQWHKWGGVEGTKNVLSREQAGYLSLMWDGHVFSSYRTGWKEPNGVLVVYEDGNPYEANAVRYEHIAAPLFGYYFNADERVDRILREARELSLRSQPDDVNGVACQVIEAQTEYGDYRVWIDPTHGFSIARAVVSMSDAKKHVFDGKAVQGEKEFAVSCHDFKMMGTVWVPMEFEWKTSQSVLGKITSSSSTTVRVKDITLNPDHDALGSFVRHDVKEDAKGWIAPAAHIRYRWHNGEFTPEFDPQIIARIDQSVQAILDEQTVSARDMTSSETTIVDHGSRGGSTNATSVDVNAIPQHITTHAQSRRPKPFCGLYCVYGALGLVGQEVSFEDLIKTEYLGSKDGSSILELRKMVVDNGMYAEPAARLRVSSLKTCPYWAILHVRSHPEAMRYDHYELFLGVKDGKARLFDPPEAPRLVSFSDLATQWDGKALLVSDHRIDRDMVLAADRRQLLYYGMAGVLGMAAMHLGARLWHFLFPAIPRRWGLCLSMGQLMAIGMSAFVFGVLYHLVADTGLLANAVATQSLQKGYTASFIPKVGEHTVRRLLESGTVFIDARLASDYERGHLNGAISLPIDANDTKWKAVTQDIPKSSPIVTYCQSAACKYAENVSLRLLEDGYANISIFKGGWMEWAGKHKQQREAQPMGKENHSEQGGKDDPT